MRTIERIPQRLYLWCNAGNTNNYSSQHSHSDLLLHLPLRNTATKHLDLLVPGVENIYFSPKHRFSVPSTRCSLRLRLHHQHSTAQCSRPSEDLFFEDTVKATTLPPLATQPRFPNPQPQRPLAFEMRWMYASNAARRSGVSCAPRTNDRGLVAVPSPTDPRTPGCFGLEGDILLPSSTKSDGSTTSCMIKTSESPNSNPTLLEQRLDHCQIAQKIKPRVGRDGRRRFILLWYDY